MCVFIYTGWDKSRFTVVSTWNTEFTFALLFISHCIIFCMNKCKPTFTPPCTLLSLTKTLPSIHAVASYCIFELKIYIILPSTSWIRYHYYSHFIDSETEAQISNWSKVPQLLWSAVRVCFLQMWAFCTAFLRGCSPPQVLSCTRMCGVTQFFSEWHLTPVSVG